MMVRYNACESEWVNALYYMSSWRVEKYTVSVCLERFYFNNVLHIKKKWFSDETITCESLQIHYMFHYIQHIRSHHNLFMLKRPYTHIFLRYLIKSFIPIFMIVSQISSKGLGVFMRIKFLRIFIMITLKHNSIHECLAIFGIKQTCLIYVSVHIFLFVKNLDNSSKYYSIAFCL